MLQASLAAVLASCFAVIILPQYDDSQIGEFLQKFTDFALAVLVILTLIFFVVSLFHFVLKKKDDNHANYME